MFTKLGNDAAFILRITLPRCALTVISLMSSSLPTCLFNIPVAARTHNPSRA